MFGFVKWNEINDPPRKRSGFRLAAYFLPFYSFPPKTPPAYSVSSQPCTFVCAINQSINQFTEIQKYRYIGEEKEKVKGKRNTQQCEGAFRLIGLRIVCMYLRWLRIGNVRLGLYVLFSFGYKERARVMKDDDGGDSGNESDSESASDWVECEYEYKYNSR